MKVFGRPALCEHSRILVVVSRPVLTFVLDMMPFTDVSLILYSSLMVASIFHKNIVMASLMLQNINIKLWINGKDDPFD